jgi:hypothetical protein
VGFPSLALAGEKAGEVYVAWEIFVSAADRSQGLGFTFSRGGGRTFAAASVVPQIAGPTLGTNGSQQGLLTRKLAVSPAGRIVLVNSTFRSGKDSHIWLLRGRR